MITEAQNVEFVHENLKRYYLHDGQIVVFEPDGAHRNTVDAWKDFTLETANNRPDGTDFHEIHDMRNSTITPYARHKAVELTQALGAVPGRSAIIISKSHTGQMIGFLVNNVFNRFNRTRVRKVFTEFEPAVTWVQEAL